MSLTTSNAFRNLDDLFFSDMYSLFPIVTNQKRNLTRSGGLFPISLRNNGDKYEVEVDVPGIKKEDIKISVENGILTISGERINKQENSHLVGSEIYYGSFSRSITLPEDINTDQVHAVHSNGVLSIIFDKDVGKQKKMITIQ